METDNLSFEDTRELYQKKLNENPESFDSNFKLGSLYCGHEYYKEAMPHLEKADTINPHSQENLQNLKTVYSQLQMFEKIKGINERIRD